jgi:hypothetical protein
MGAGEEGSAALGDLNSKLFRNVIRTQSYASFLFVYSFVVPIDHRLSDYCAHCVLVHKATMWNMITDSPL